MRRHHLDESLSCASLWIARTASHSGCRARRQLSPGEWTCGPSPCAPSLCVAKTRPVMNDWDRAKQLFARALELKPEERERFLATACAGEDLLRGELDSLLSAYVQA